MSLYTGCNADAADGVCHHLPVSGHERFNEILLARWLRFKKRKPQKAEQYFTKATQLVEQYNAKVVRLPEAVAERLTLPDLAELEKEDDRPDPFDRLSEQAQDI